MFVLVLFQHVLSFPNSMDIISPLPTSQLVKTRNRLHLFCLWKNVVYQLKQLNLHRWSGSSLLLLVCYDHHAHIVIHDLVPTAILCHSGSMTRGLSKTLLAVAI